MAETKEYPIVIVQLSEADGGGFFGFAPDLPGCMSDGETREEALENTLEALEEWMEVQLERGVEIPAPGAASEAAIQRENKLFDAIKSLVDYRDEADERIAGLERKLTELIAILQEDGSGRRARFSVPTVQGKTRKRIAH